MTQEPAALTSARLEAHHAVQLVGQVGTTWLTHDAAFQYGNLSWDPARGVFVGREVEGLHGALHLESLTWWVLRGEEVLARKPAIGATVAEGAAWFRETLVAAGLPDRPLQAEEWDLPAHAVQQGAAFEGAGDRAALARWFDAALALLAPISSAGSELRCWPHHFDLATLITVEAHEDPHQAKTIGVGFSPGDGGIDEPYLYVTPWPYPPEPWPSPALPDGSWNPEGWFGAVLRASDVADRDADRLRAFADAAIEACRSIL